MLLSARLFVNLAPANFAVLQACFIRNAGSLSGSCSEDEVPFKISYSESTTYKSRPSKIHPGSSPRSWLRPSSSVLNSVAVKACSNVFGIELNILILLEWFHREHVHSLTSWSSFILTSLAKLSPYSSIPSSSFCLESSVVKNICLSKMSTIHQQLKIRKGQTVAQAEEAILSCLYQIRSV